MTIWFLRSVPLTPHHFPSILLTSLVWQYVLARVKKKQLEDDVK
jgi:hypothetical protein